MGVLAANNINITLQLEVKQKMSNERSENVKTREICVGGK
jgi:hypothetical protein